MSPRSHPNQLLPIRVRLVLTAVVAQGAVRGLQRGHELRCDGVAAAPCDIGGHEQQAHRPDVSRLPAGVDGEPRRAVQGRLVVLVVVGVVTVLAHRLAGEGELVGQIPCANGFEAE